MNNGNKVGSSCLLDCLLQCNSFSFIFPYECMWKSPVISEPAVVIYFLFFFLSSIHSLYSVFIESVFPSLSVFHLLVFVCLCVVLSPHQHHQPFFRQMENFMLHFKHGALKLLNVNVKCECNSCALFQTTMKTLWRACWLFFVWSYSWWK